jgi:Fe-S cluster biosynthesis and repair protein YggX
LIQAAILPRNGRVRLARLRAGLSGPPPPRRNKPKPEVLAGVSETLIKCCHEVVVAFLLPIEILAGTTTRQVPYTHQFLNLERTTPMTRMVNCIKLGKEAEGLDFPPYPGPLGKRLWEEVSKQAWADWMKQQTMLVNENRLNLADARARQYLARQMEQHFFGSGADVVQGYVPPTA